MEPLFKDHQAWGGGQSSSEGVASLGPHTSPGLWPISAWSEGQVSPWRQPFSDPGRSLLDGSALDLGLLARYPGSAQLTLVDESHAGWGLWLTPKSLARV